ncbi:MAG: hypothetical protein HKN74_14405 [Acidimicrobiia bacterium]|nr:hypothetical protein [Acidimicrobiia bacterium]MBT8216531.1 hypothetical protein [Acidimicrobiia bacterium]NNF11466.1 hypothetical protein [Acidimicrobiia bacterium]NNL71318.1 hypothetical protein [Acidimicrobiia bacterium]
MLRPRSHAAFWLAALSFLPLFVWWLGWFPAFLSPDSLDQLTQADTGEFTNGHPAFHTILIWAITRVWDSPGAVSLVQIVALAGVLGLVARRLVELGTSLWAAVGAAWLVGLAPAVGPTALSIWKDVAFTIAFLWVFAELLALVRQGSAFWAHPPAAIRLGAALALLWLTRHNGFLTVLAVVVVLVIVFRNDLAPLAPAAAALVAAVVLVMGPLYWVFSVERERPAPGEVLLPLVASSYVHEPGSFSPADIALLESIAPLEVWQERYDCDSGDRLLFDPEMNIAAIRSDPNPLLRLGLRTVARDPDTSLGFLWCRASYLFVPAQPAEAFLQRPPFAIPENDLGLTRDPISEAAYDFTREVYRVANDPAWLWLLWRPAVVIWAALATYAALARPGTRHVLLPGSLLGAHLINVAATSLNHEFRLAFPLYVAGIMSLPLLWFAADPARLAAGAVVVDGGTLPNGNVGSVRPGQGAPQGGE